MGQFLDQCAFCHNTWGHCNCESLDEAEGLEWDDTIILSPNIDATGRFFVDPVKYYGKKLVDEYWKRISRVYKGQPLN